MSKYDFIKMGNKVKCDPFNDGNYIVAQVYTSVPENIQDDTLVNIITANGEECEEVVDLEPVRADELKPYLEDFNKGYWCAVQDACSNGCSDTVIKSMLHAAGFTYDECMWLIDDSDFESERLVEIVENSFVPTLHRLSNNLDFEPEFLNLELFDGTSIRGMVIDQRIDKTNDTMGYHIYDIRQSDDTLELASLEKNVLVNWECSIAFEKPIAAIENGNHLSIEDYVYESWEDAATNVLEEKYEDRPEIREQIPVFVCDYWENLEFFSVNIERFNQYLIDMGISYEASGH